MRGHQSCTCAADHLYQLAAPVAHICQLTVKVKELESQSCVWLAELHL